MVYHKGEKDAVTMKVLPLPLTMDKSTKTIQEALDKTMKKLTGTELLPNTMFLDKPNVGIKLDPKLTANKESFDLYAIIQANTPKNATATVKQPDGTWTLFNDDKTPIKTKAPDVSMTQTALLVYKKSK